MRRRAFLSVLSSGINLVSQAEALVLPEGKCRDETDLFDAQGLVNTPSICHSELTTVAAKPGWRADGRTCRSAFAISQIACAKYAKWRMHPGSHCAYNKTINTIIMKIYGASVVLGGSLGF
jgi:hypothetical protein